MVPVEKVQQYINFNQNLEGVAEGTRPKISSHGASPK